MLRKLISGQPPPLKAGGAALTYYRTLRDLDAELVSIEKRSKVLDGLLSSGKISEEAYAQINERLKNLSSKIRSLKESLEEEKSLQLLNVEKCAEVLELLLVDLRCGHTLGEVDDGEWNDKSQILIRGIRSLKEGVSRLVGDLKEPAPPDFFVSELETRSLFEPESILEERAAEGNAHPKRGLKKESRRKRKRTKPSSRGRLPSGMADRRVKAPPEIPQTGIYCRNPWNTECRNTDIELTIYYNGELLPICRECWKEISEKNIEWSSY